MSTRKYVAVIGWYDLIVEWGVARAEIWADSEDEAREQLRRIIERHLPQFMAQWQAEGERVRAY